MPANQRPWYITVRPKNFPTCQVEAQSSIDVPLESATSALFNTYQYLIRLLHPRQGPASRCDAPAAACLPHRPRIDLGRRLTEYRHRGADRKRRGGDKINNSDTLNRIPPLALRVISSAARYLSHHLERQ